MPRTEPVVHIAFSDATERDVHGAEAETVRTIRIACDLRRGRTTATTTPATVDEACRFVFFVLEQRHALEWLTLYEWIRERYSATGYSEYRLYRVTEGRTTRIDAAEVII